MNYPDLFRVMIGIAIATPILGVLILLIGRAGAAGSDEPMPPSMKRNAIILAVAGPANLLLWWAYNAWHTSQGPGSAFGIVLAAIVFIVAGLATGLFARLFGKK